MENKIADSIPRSRVYLTDNLKYMKLCKDGEFDIGIVDPEYRDDNEPTEHMRKKTGMKNWYGTPKAEYFEQLFRITKHQIIFGGNYFTDILDFREFKKSGDTQDIKPFLEANNNWFLWNKGFTDGKNMNWSMCEMAWVSIRKNVKLFKLIPSGKCYDWHPTSKPKQIYDYLFNTYCQEGWKILDTNLGSGTSREVAYHSKLNLDFTGLELNKDYFNKSIDAFHKSIDLGAFGEKPKNQEQFKLF